jgi:hypothetical protein
MLADLALIVAIVNGCATLASRFAEARLRWRGRARAGQERHPQA